MGKKSDKKKDKRHSSSESDRRSDKKKSKHKHKKKDKSKSRENRDRGGKYRRDRSNDKHNKDQKKKDDQQRWRFDSPPKEHELAQGILAAAASLGGGGGAVTGNTQAILQSILNIQMAQTAKIDRKLYFGNLPQGITQRMLIDVVNEAMLSLGILEEPGNPVVSAWISSDGHYAFVEFRTAEEANHGFKLQGMNIQGTEIKIGRPKAYNGTMSALGLMSNAGGGNSSGVTPSTIMGLKNPVQNVYHALDDFSTQGIQNPLMGGKMADELFMVQVPTRVLKINNIVTLNQVKDDNSFSDLYSDVMDMCLQFGKVLQIKIPRPVFVDRIEQNKIEDEEEYKLQERLQREKESKEEGGNGVDQQKDKKKNGSNNQKKESLPPFEDPRNYDFPEGFGSVFVEFTSTHEARRARRNIHLLKYNGIVAECEYFDVDNFDNNVFKRLEKIKIEQRNQEFEGLENVAIEFTEPRQSEPMKI